MKGRQKISGISGLHTGHLAGEGGSAVSYTKRGKPADLIRLSYQLYITHNCTQRCVPVFDLCEYPVWKGRQKDYQLSGTGFFWCVSSPRGTFDDLILYERYICGVSDPESRTDGGSDPCYCFWDLAHRHFDRPDPCQSV